MKGVLPVIFISLILGLFGPSCKRAEKSGQEEIVIIKYATHPALNDVENGFLEEFKKAKGDVKIIQMNANGNPLSAKQLAESATARKPGAILALATPASQAVARTSSEVPFVYAAVSDPEGAGLISARSTGIRNVDDAIIGSALDSIMEFKKDTKKIGSIYNPSEQNSVFVQGILSRLCKERGLELIVRTAYEPEQLGPMAEQLAKSIDVLYCANDNNVNSGVRSLAKACKELKLPFVIGELSAVGEGALFGVGVEYAAIGRSLSPLMVEVLRAKDGGKFPERLGAPRAELWLNEKVAAEIGVSFSEGMTGKASKKF